MPANADGANYDFSVDAEVIEFIEAVEHDAAIRHADWRQEALLNLAWVSGHQDIGNISNTIATNPYYKLYDDMPAVWTNYVRRVVNQQIARIIMGEFNFATIANKPDEHSVASSRVAERVLNYLWNNLGFESPESLQRGLHYAICTGVAFAEAVWDPGRGQIQVIKGEEVEAVVQEFVRQAGDDIGELTDGEAFQALLSVLAPGMDQGRLLRLDNGDIIFRDGFPRVRFLSGFNVIEDWTGDRWEDKSWVITREFVSPEDLRKEFPNAPDEAIAPTQSELTDLSQSTPRLSGDYYGSQHRRPSTLRYRLWTKPLDPTLNTELVVVANRNVLHRQESPYSHRELPLTPIFDSPDCYDVRPSPLMTDIRVLNAEYNYVKNQIARWLRQAERPQTLAEVKQIPDQRKFADPKQRIKTYRHVPNVPPPRSDPPVPVPADLFRHAAMLAQEIQQLGGITEISMGQTSPQATSGVAIQAHTENTDRMAILLHRSLTYAVGRIGRQLLGLIGEFMPDETVFSMMGEGERTEAVVFRGSDFIDSDADGAIDALKYDVDVTIGQAPSPTRVMEVIDWLLQRSIMDPIRDSKMILEAVSTGRLPEGLDPNEKDRLNAARVVKRILEINKAVLANEVDPIQALKEQASFMMPQPADLPDVFVETIIGALVKDREVWEKMHPQIAEFVLAIVSQHQKIEDEARQKQAQQSEGDENERPAEQRQSGSRGHSSSGRQSRGRPASAA